MKTTVEISDALLDRARRVVAEERTTLKALIEEGLRHALEERTKPRRFKLRKVSFSGKGLHPELRDAPWSAIRDLAYKR